MLNDREWKLIPERREGRPKVDRLKLHIPTAAASPSFVLSCFVCARHKPWVEVSLRRKVLLLILKTLTRRPVGPSPQLLLSTEAASGSSCTEVNLRPHPWFRFPHTITPPVTLLIDSQLCAHQFHLAQPADAQGPISDCFCYPFGCHFIVSFKHVAAKSYSFQLVHCKK